MSGNKRFISQLYSQIDIAVHDFINNVNHKYHSFLYNDLSDFIQPDAYNVKYLTINTHYFSFRGTQKIPLNNKFETPVKIAIITNAGIFILKTTVLFNKELDFQAMVVSYQIDAFIH